MRNAPRLVFAPRVSRSEKEITEPSGQKTCNCQMRNFNEMLIRF